MISRLFQFGNGGRTNQTRQAAAMAKRSAPVISGGSISVATLAAALFTPQMTRTATIAAISSGVSACGEEEELDTPSCLPQGATFRLSRIMGGGHPSPRIPTNQYSLSAAAWS